MSNDSPAGREPAASPPDVASPGQPSRGPGGEPDGISELLQELRVLITGVQVLTGFLLIVPFNQDFRGIALVEKWVYLSAFVCGLISLIVFSAPAAEHRLQRPLRDPARFKQYTTRMTVIGLVFLSLALLLTTHLVVTRTVGAGAAHVITACVAVLLAAVWWIWPLTARRASQVGRASR